MDQEVVALYCKIYSIKPPLPDPLESLPVSAMGYSYKISTFNVEIFGQYIWSVHRV